MFGSKKWLTGLAVALLVAIAAPAQAQTTLRYKFKEGENLPYTAETKATMKLDFGGKEINMDMSQTMEQVWNIKSVEDGKAKIHIKPGRVQFAMDMGGLGKVEYDSKDGKMPAGPVGQMIGPVFKALSEAEFTLTMDTRGEVTDVKIPEKVLKALKGPQLPGLGDMLSPENIKKMVSAIPLPKDAVAKGKSWEQKLAVKAGFGEMKVENKFTYEGQVDKGGRKLEHISVKPSVSIEADPNSPLGIKLKDGGGKGTAYFDNESGRLVEMAQTQNMTMEVAGQTIEMIQTTTLRLNQAKSK